MGQLGDLLKAVVLVTIMGSIFLAAIFFVIYLVPMLVVIFVVYFVYLMIKSEGERN